MKFRYLQVKSLTLYIGKIKNIKVYFLSEINLKVFAYVICYKCMEVCAMYCDVKLKIAGRELRLASCSNSVLLFDI